MRACLYPIFETEDPDFGALEVFMTTTQEHQDELVLLAQILGVTPLPEFINRLKLAEAYAEELSSELRASLEARENWFDASDGLQTANALHDALEAGQGENIRDHKTVMLELGALAKALEDAVSRNIRFSLMIDA